MVSVLGVLVSVLVPPVDAGALPTVDVVGEVVDAQNRPVGGVRVFATGQGGALVRAHARSGSDGRFQISLPAVPHDFGVLSPRWALLSLEQKVDGWIRLRVHAAFTEATLEPMLAQVKTWAPMLVRPRGQTDEPASITYGLSIGRLSGRVLDESGAPLGGVLVIALDGRKGQPVSVTVTDPKGRYDLVTIAGLNKITAITAGLKLVRATRSPTQGLELVMTIDAAVEKITVRTGRVLSFKMTDSIWPEYLPPPQVKMLLEKEYRVLIDQCFCPGDLRNRYTAEGTEADLRRSRPPSRSPCNLPPYVRCKGAASCPASVWQRQCKIPKFWWLRLLDHEPPNPAGPVDRWWEDVIRNMQLNEAQAESPPK